MPRSKKDRRQAAIREYERRQEATRSTSPLSSEQLDALWIHVAQQYAAHGHDGTLKQTNLWLTTNGADVARCINFLAAHEIDSDFEVVNRCDPRQLFGTIDGYNHRMPLDYDQLNALLDHLDSAIPAAGCNHDYRLTEAWLRSNAIIPWQVTMACQALGGYCDCEILFNVEPSDVYVDD